MDDKFKETPVDTDRFKSTEDMVDKLFNKTEELPSELKAVSENMIFEKRAEEHPIPPGIGKTRVFGCETWDINSILKGNYWRRSIYTTDKLCKLFLKADLNSKKKYLKKKNPQSMNFLWIMLLMFGVVIAIVVIMVLLPKLGVM